ncbi:MAG: aminomethyl-transferring glycine dehydrogenase subunit GcvPA [Alicyclobacillus sp.]|nr:aminomethyl-transferring glycine dehydrogenase subunit GcvPA [Alicyclobacillus sp.]
MKPYSYLPHTPEDRRRMLEAIGVSDVSELFRDIPDEVRMKRPLNLPEGQSELELDRHMRRLAEANQDVSRLVSFLGAGSYEHFRPSVIDAIVGRSEFYTSYTPYQPEISQGMLQATFEYQTMICELTGMDVANASMYDGPTALGEAALVCCNTTGRNRLLVPESLNPEYRSVVATYAAGQSVDLATIPCPNGVLEVSELARCLDSSVAGVLVQYPNFFGCVEDLGAIAEAAHRAGSLVAVAAYPIALGWLRSPGALGADLVVAEGQPLGGSLSYGGPYLGIMAARQAFMRHLPGRIVGQTTDAHGRRGFVLTLQAREQHIRREKASSNICSNQALNALAAAVYLSWLGPRGLRELARHNYHKAHYLASRLAALPGVRLAFNRPFFNEFTLRLPKPVAELQQRLQSKGYLFGLHLGAAFGRRYTPAEERTATACWRADLEDAVLVAVTEVRTRAELDGLVRELEGWL